MFYRCVFLNKVLLFLSLSGSLFHQGFFQLLLMPSAYRIKIREWFTNLRSTAKKAITCEPKYTEAFSYVQHLENAKKKYDERERKEGQRYFENITHTHTSSNPFQPLHVSPRQDIWQSCLSGHWSRTLLDIGCGFECRPTFLCCHSSCKNSRLICREMAVKWTYAEIRLCALREQQRLNCCRISWRGESGRRKIKIR